MIRVLLVDAQTLSNLKKLEIISDISQTPFQLRFQMWFSLMDLVRNEFRMESCQELVKIHGIYFACVDLAEVMHVILELGFFNSSSSSSSVNAIVVNNSGSSFL